MVEARGWPLREDPFVQDALEVWTPAVVKELQRVGHLSSLVDYSSLLSSSDCLQVISDYLQLTSESRPPFGCWRMDLLHCLHVALERVDLMIRLQSVPPSVESSRLEPCESSFCASRFVASQVLLPFEWLPSGVAFMFAGFPLRKLGINLLNPQWSRLYVCAQRRGPHENTVF